MQLFRPKDFRDRQHAGRCTNACATCHVYVDESWLDKLETMDPDEELMLSDALDLQDNSRLSCQIKMSEALNGIKVTLAPEF